MTFSLATLVFFLFPIHFPLVFSYGPIFPRDGQKSYSQIEIPRVIGPVSIEFDCHGQGPYIDVSDGKILKWQGANLGLTQFVVTSPHRVRIFTIITNDRTGRLLKYDPRIKKVEVLLRGLAFPNGVALSKDHSFLVLAESSTLKVLKVHLQDPKHFVEIFSQLAAFLNDIKRNPNGDFWIGLNIRRGRMLNLENTKNWRQGGNVMDSMAVRLDEKGNVLEFVDGKF